MGEALFAKSVQSCVATSPSSPSAQCVCSMAALSTIPSSVLSSCPSLPQTLQSQLNANSCGCTALTQFMETAVVACVDDVSANAAVPALQSPAQRKCQCTTQLLNSIPTGLKDACPAYQATAIAALNTSGCSAQMNSSCITGEALFAKSVQSCVATSPSSPSAQCVCSMAALSTIQVTMGATNVGFIESGSALLSMFKRMRPRLPTVNLLYHRGLHCGSE